MIDAKLRQAITNAKGAIGNPEKGRCFVCAEALYDADANPLEGSQVCGVESDDLEMILKALDERDKLLDNYAFRSPALPISGGAGQGGHNG